MHVIARMNVGGPAELVVQLLRGLPDQSLLTGEVDDGEAVALLRACLTHPEAARVMRDEVMCDRIGAVASAIGGDDAELRAGLLGACLIGLTIARQLLTIEPVASADRADLERLLEPALRALVDGST